MEVLLCSRRHRRRRRVSPQDHARRGRGRARDPPSSLPDGRHAEPRSRLATVEILSSGHEQVVFCSDAGLGAEGDHRHPLDGARPGARRHPVLPVRQRGRRGRRRAARCRAAMSYKNSLAGLDLGGGKAVIIGDPRTDKTEALLRAYGRFVEALGGRYLTACDVGTYNADLDVVARETRFAHGRSEAYGGCGDSSVLTAYGVFLGMQAAAQHRWGAPDAGRAHRRGGRRRQGGLAPDRPPGRRRRRRRRHRRRPRRGRAGAGPAPAGEGRRPTPPPWSAPRTTSTPPTPSAARWTRRPWRCCPPGSSAAAPTTSSPRPRSPSSCASAASSTPPTTW